MFKSAYSGDRATGERSLGDYQRTSRKEDQNRLAVLDRVGQKQIEPTLSERFCWQLEIRENLVSRLLNRALTKFFWHLFKSEPVRLVLYQRPNVACFDLWETFKNFVNGVLNSLITKLFEILSPSP